jgi:hypothetical protein
MKIMENFSHDSQCPNQDLNQATPKYRCAILASFFECVTHVDEYQCFGENCCFHLQGNEWSAQGKFVQIQGRQDKDEYWSAFSLGPSPSPHNYQFYPICSCFYPKNAVNIPNCNSITFQIILSLILTIVRTSKFWNIKPAGLNMLTKCKAIGFTDY